MHLPTQNKSGAGRALPVRQRTWKTSLLCGGRCSVILSLKGCASGLPSSSARPMSITVAPARQLKGGGGAADSFSPT